MAHAHFNTYHRSFEAKIEFLREGTEIHLTDGIFRIALTVEEAIALANDITIAIEELKKKERERGIQPSQ